MHPLVRDLYKRALSVGRDYPLGLAHVRRTWKRALRDPTNCPSCWSCHWDDVPFGPHDQNHDKQQQQQQQRSSPAARIDTTTAAADCSATPLAWSASTPFPEPCERELRKAVGKGRFMIREMVALIQLKKYRTMKQRYTTT